MQTRKHFELAASIIRKIEDEAERKLIARKTAAGYEKQNPRFDKKRFYKACNV